VRGLWIAAAVAAIAGIAVAFGQGVGHRACAGTGLLPDRACTPGVVETTDLAVVCGTSTRERRHVDVVTKRRVLAAYSLPVPQPAGAYEIDHLVPLCLGGSNDEANLWPEPAPSFEQKDRVELELHRLVCAGRVSLPAAQRAIATDWTTALQVSGEER
jgi:hypothetical protein